jgi:hypothetical protein
VARYYDGNICIVSQFWDQFIKTNLSPLSLQQAIYPTVIIILVSKYMSQSDVVHTKVGKGNHDFPSAETCANSDGNPRGILSTIHFEVPQFTSNTSTSTTHGQGSREQEDRGQKPKDSEAV